MYCTDSTYIYRYRSVHVITYLPFFSNPPTSLHPFPYFRSSPSITPTPSRYQSSEVLSIWNVQGENVGRLACLPGTDCFYQAWQVDKFTL
ncbi:hypothetical protein C0J52_18791 [Blattella germanica]|nr:hypothetical protein C0J52_18791 [Blattella germanica]